MRYQAEASGCKKVGGFQVEGARVSGKGFWVDAAAAAGRGLWWKQPRHQPEDSGFSGVRDQAEDL